MGKQEDKIMNKWNNYYHCATGFEYQKISHIFLHSTYDAFNFLSS